MFLSIILFQFLDKAVEMVIGVFSSMNVIVRVMIYFAKRSFIKAHGIITPG